MKNFLLSLVLVLSTTAFAQVGVQTDDPKGTFHIDGNKDNTPGAISEEQIKNDVIVKQNGNMGVGVENPATKVDIKADSEYKGFKLVDGNQGNNKVLTSDAEGKATWKIIKQPTFKVNLGSVSNYTHTPTKAEHDAGKFVKYTGAKVTLPKGTSLVQLSLYVQANARANIGGERFLKFILWDNNGNGEPAIGHAISNTTFSSNSPRILSYAMHPGMVKGFVNGPISVTNNSGADRTYYLYVDTDQSDYYKISITDGNITHSGINTDNDEYYKLSEFTIIFKYAETSLFYQTVEEL